VAVAEGIGDPTAPVTTEAGDLVNVPVVPDGVAAYEGTVPEAVLPVGAPGALVPSTNQVADTGASSSVTTLAEQNSPSSWWHAGLGIGVLRFVLAYGVLSNTVSCLTQTLWHEIVAAVEDQGARGLLRNGSKARFPAASGK
jgi:hypothetical protein